jgi:tRNA modification GTPase
MIPQEISFPAALNCCTFAPMSALFNDTIAAPATAPGVGAIAVLRLSGSEAISIANGVFKGKSLSDCASHTLHFGKIYEADTLIDEVVVSLFKAPNSYTGEDVVEISCHGSPYIVERILRLLLHRGARPARAGEFTLRAFLNGKLDLAQAEAVADLIASDSEAAHRMALTQLRGGFSDHLKAMRSELIHFASLIELELDFAEEDVDFADRAQLSELLLKAERALSLLIASFRSGNAFKNGIPVAIVGKPNAGKSTLLNALLNEERAIVTDIAGTTRDTLEDRLNIEGVMFRFIDTAGIRETHDLIESIGVERSRKAMREAHIALFLYDAASESPEAIKVQLDEAARLCAEAGNLLIAVANKTDLLPPKVREELENTPSTLCISAKNKLGIEALKSALLSRMKLAHQPGDVVVSNARHLHALTQAREALLRANTGLNSGNTGDLLAADIRQVLYFMGLITGEINTEDLLDNIFSKFCIGK